MSNWRTTVGKTPADPIMIRIPVQAALPCSTYVASLSHSLRYLIQLHPILLRVLYFAWCYLPCLSSLDCHFTLLYLALLHGNSLYFISLYSVYFREATLLCFALLHLALLYFTLLYFTLLYFTLLYFTYLIQHINPA